MLFKEFGIRLNFTPTIAGDVIRLKVRPEVSSLDFANGITPRGFRIPALTTRRAETDVELRDGQSFAIAGLLDNVSQNDAAAIPLLSKLPIIGPCSRARPTRAEQTELMVLITPRLVRPLDPDEVPPLPTDPDRSSRSRRRPAQAARGGRRHRRRARRDEPNAAVPASVAGRKPIGRDAGSDEAVVYGSQAGQLATPQLDAARCAKPGVQCRRVASADALLGTLAQPEREQPEVLLVDLREAAADSARAGRT